MSLSSKAGNLLMDLGEVRLPVLYTKVHESAVDKVERLTVSPVFINIIKLELDICRHTINCQLQNIISRVERTSLTERATSQRQ